MIFLNNILVFFCNLSQHEKHIQKILKAFFKAKKYAKRSKYLFSLTCILFSALSL